MSTFSTGSFPTGGLRLDKERTSDPWTFSNPPNLQRRGETWPRQFSNPSLDCIVFPHFEYSQLAPRVTAVPQCRFPHVKLASTITSEFEAGNTVNQPVVELDPFVSYSSDRPSDQML